MESLLGEAFTWVEGEPSLRPGVTLTAAHMRTLARTSALDASPGGARARLAIRAAAAALGAFPASIANFYAARGAGEVAGFTVPAVNIRGLTFDIASALFRAIIAEESIAIFEINRAELGFTGQDAESFACSVLAAAIAEGYRGPVFLQADHMIVNAKAFAADPAAELSALRAVIESCLDASFLNVDIDASTVVDLSFADVASQQRENAEVTATLARGVRAWQAEHSAIRQSVEISLGGEIGEVGAHNSTVEELDSFVEQTHALYPGAHLRKISVQTGTKHGGVVLPDGAMADVSLDFNTLRDLSAAARQRYGMAGAVQHGASTLPEAMFGRFPEVGTAEVHLATGFQNLVFDHPRFPPDLLREMEAYALTKLGQDRRPGESDAQFLHLARRKLWGPFQASLWEIEAEPLVEIRESLTSRFRALMRSLRASGLRPAVEGYTRPA